VFVCTPIELTLMMCPPLRPFLSRLRIVGSRHMISFSEPK
jgi:hypothetical protein